MQGTEEFGAAEQDPNLAACDEVVSDPDQANGVSEILSLTRSQTAYPALQRHLHPQSPTGHSGIDSGILSPPTANLSKS